MEWFIVIADAYCQDCFYRTIDVFFSKWVQMRTGDFIEQLLEPRWPEQQRKVTNYRYNRTDFAIKHLPVLAPTDTRTQSLIFNRNYNEHLYYYCRINSLRIQVPE